MIRTNSDISEHFHELGGEERAPIMDQVAIAPFGIECFRS
jgi:hypothetical protein